MNLHPSHQLELNARLQAQANLLAEMDPSAATFRPSPLQQQMLQQQQQLQRRMPITKPGKQDVILGRGKPFQNWPGNQFMLSLCDCYRERYHAAERAQKNSIIQEVMDVIKSRGGRFLQRHENFKVNCWVEVSERISYRKIGHAFRSNSRRLTAEKNAEIAAAEEAARTGKKFEEVLAESQMKKAAAAAAKASGSEERPKSPPEDLPLAVTTATVGGITAANTAASASLPMVTTVPSFPASADAMWQLEVRRRNLEEREQRLFQMRMEMQAELETRNAMLPAGYAMPGSFYNARGMSPMGMGMSSMGSLQAYGGTAPHMNPALLAQQRAAMASNLSPSFAFHGGGGMGMGAGLLGGPSAAMPTMNSMVSQEMGMELAMARAGRLPPRTLGGPIHNDEILVDMLVKRSQMMKPPLSIAELNAVPRKSSTEEGKEGKDPMEKKKKGGKRKHNKH